MTDEPTPPQQPGDDQDENQPDPGPTRRLDKAIEDMETGDLADGTLVSIEAHTGEHPIPPDPSVTDALSQAKRSNKSTPDIQPAATMYEPTQPGHVSAGSTEKTVFGPTGTAGAPNSNAGSMHQPGGGRPVAPFGGKIVVGTRIGQIEVTGVLGKGGMGEVFKGYHQALDINVAIKVLPDELSRNELVRQRFLREARLCVKLDHPHIVRVYNVDEYAGNLYLVMEMIEGTDAAHMLKNGGRFRYKRALEIGAASADALAYAHTQGLVHRDVKPHNILLGAADGKIKLSDFGLARAATSSSHLTMSGQIMGTPHYMSPEQAESKEVSDKSDVYSLGVTLYHMLTGETPFVGDTPISVAVQHIAKEIIYPEIRFKPFPKELVAVLKRMTAKDAAKRCSAKQAAVWLRKLIGMAPQDDIAAGDDGAMKSMAPVVRESQAFEAAAKEREQRDHHARELAQTMLATIQEDSARRAAVPQPTQAASQPSSSQVIIERRGSGGLVAVLLLMIIVGGGGAAWYFTLGPGAQKDNKSDQPIAASNDAANTSSGNTTANSAGNTGTVGTDAGPVDGDTSDDGGTVDGGTTDVSADDGGAIDDGSVDGTELPPPEEIDDPTVAGYLGGAETSITNANTLADLDPVKRKLDQAWLVIKQGKGSEKQRAEFDKLKAQYDQQRAYLGATESFTKIDSALASFEEKRGDDNGSAIDFLNAAVKERDRLLALVVPEAVKELVDDERDANVERVNDALGSFWSELDKEATRLLDQNQFDAAASALAEMERIENTPEALAGVRDRRKVVQIRGLHKSILDDLDIPDFKDAASLVKKAEEIGVPESLKTAHAQVKAAMTSKIEETVQSYLTDAKAGVTAEDFIAARNALDAATELPEKTPEQKTQVADMVFFVTLSEQLLNADKAIQADSFKEARKQLDEAKLTLDGAQNRTVPQELKERYTTLTGDFDTQLSSRFEELLSAAKSKLEDREFEAASESMNDADKLPLTTAQRERLDTFKADSQIALDEFVRELITKIEKALDDNEFDKAQTALATADALPVPDDLKTKLDELRGRFATEAVKRHGELLATARSALELKKWIDSRAALDAALKIPVAESLAKDAENLNAEYMTALEAEVAKFFEAGDKLLEEGKFHDARLSIESAASLPLNDDLDRQVKRRLKLVADALEAHFAEQLRKAGEATDAKLFRTAETILDDVEALEDLTQPQMIRLSDAQDKYKKAIEAYQDDLFKDLKKAVDKGDEKEGNEIVNKLEKLGFLDPGEQSKLRTLKAALVGETDSARVARLPRHLKVLWNDRNCKAEQLITIGEEVTALNVTSDGKYAVAGTASGRVFFYNLKRGTQLGSSKGGSRRITAVAFSEDGNVAASGNDDGNLVLFDLSGSSVQARDMGSVGDDVFGLIFNSNASVLYVATRDAALTRYNPNTRTKLGTVATGLDRAQCIALSSDNKLLAIGGDDGEIAVFDANRMVLKETLDGPGDDMIQSVSFSADNSQLMAGSIGDDVAVWDTNRLTKKPTKEFQGLSEWVRGVGFSEDGRRCAAFDSEERLIVWDVRSGTELRRLDFSEKLKGDKDFMPSAGVIGADGTVLIGTREGELVHMSLKSAGE